MKKLFFGVLVFLILFASRNLYAVSEEYHASLELMPDMQADRAGKWGEFKPGRAYSYDFKKWTYGPKSADNNQSYLDDWVWKLRLHLPERKVIDYMTMIHNLPGEAWSTSIKTVYNKGPYPLVVDYNGRQINSAYDQEIGSYGPGMAEFYLYGQKEFQRFFGSKLIIHFKDGLAMIVDAPRVVFVSEDFPECNEKLVNFDPGVTWKVQEGIDWTGEWMRIEGAQKFTGNWHHAPTGQIVTDEMEIVERSGLYIKIYRKGTKGYYHGILSCDGNSIIKGVSDWTDIPWAAQIYQTTGGEFDKTPGVVSSETVKRY